MSDRSTLEIWRSILVKSCVTIKQKGCMANQTSELCRVYNTISKLKKVSEHPPIHIIRECYIPVSNKSLSRQSGDKIGGKQSVE